mmetsp:Transcript_84919/g.274506  ORF Transcript_84919/g.274506 Transcript_84919/m.274506 type:complete len:207 (+) Transcript_84919:933-1553(+)
MSDRGGSRLRARRCSLQARTRLRLGGHQKRPRRRHRRALRAGVLRLRPHLHPRLPRGGHAWHGHRGRLRTFRLHSDVPELLEGHLGQQRLLAAAAAQLPDLGVRPPEPRLQHLAHALPRLRCLGPAKAPTCDRRHGSPSEGHRHHCGHRSLHLRTPHLGLRGRGARAARPAVRRAPPAAACRGDALDDEAGAAAEVPALLREVVAA